MRNFSKIVSETVDGFLFEKGFSYSTGQYISTLPNGIRCMIAFDNKGVDTNSFNVMIFINSTELDNEQGAYCVCYFTGGSLSESPRKLPCNNIKSLKSRLQSFIDSYDSVIKPYLSSFTSCADIANALANNSGLSWYRGDLYLCSGQKNKAKEEYQLWIDHVQTLSYLSEEKILEAINETKSKINSCA